MTKLDLEILKDRLLRLKENYDLLFSLKSLSKDEFLSDPKNQRTIIHALQWAIEACIDIGNHIISRNSWGIPKDYAEIFQILGEKNVIPKEFAGELTKMARFRNRIVHLYWKVDWEEVYKIFQDKLEDLKVFKEQIEKFILKKKDLS